MHTATQPHRHAIVFVDHTEARVLFPSSPVDDGGHVHAHRSTKSKDGHRQMMDRRDLDAIAGKLKGIDEILIAGPSSAKAELHHFLQEHHADIATHVVEVVALDHLSIGEIKDFARTKFKHIDLWR